MTKLSSICVLFLLLLAKPLFAADLNNFYRNFWHPTYHGQRLNYCTLDGKCGLPVACLYCKMLGYQTANKAIIDHNVGLTHFILNKKKCVGWKCNGFKLIRCVGKMNHTPPARYYYRSFRFVFPRFENYRVDWCYADNKGCGQRAAYSFCRRMGYSKAQHYKKQCNVPATKAIGNQQLCFGPQCNAFSFITCFR